MSEKIFELATRNKYRFPFKGLISVEELWDLRPVDLDKIFRTLNSLFKETQEKSLLETQSKEDKVLATKIEIVKYIVSVKLREQQERDNEALRKQHNQEIMEIIEQKKREAKQSLSIEELEKLIQ